MNILRSLPKILLFLMIELWDIGAAIGSPTTVTVDLNHTYRPVPKDDLGLNCAAWDQLLTAASTRRLLSETGTRAFRYPGGSWADSFDWTVRRSEGLPTTGDFAGVVNKHSADASIILNYGDGTPQMAAAWASYCDAAVGDHTVIGLDRNGRDWRTAGYWAFLRSQRPLQHDDGLNLLRLNRAEPLHFLNYEVGNECYGGWEQDTHIPAHDPVEYGIFFSQTSQLIHKIIPTAKVGAVITGNEDDFGDQQETVVNPRTKATHSGWTAVLLSTLRAEHVYPNFLIYHYYPELSGQEDDRSLLHASHVWPTTAAAIDSMITDYLGSGGRNTKIECTENNSVAFNPGKQSTSLVNALYCADSFGSIIQTDFSSFYWWDLHNATNTGNNNSGSLYGWRMYGDYGICSRGDPQRGASINEPYPTFYALKMIGLFCSPGDTPVQCTSTSDELTGYSVLGKDHTLRILFINKDSTNTIDARLIVPKYRSMVENGMWTYGEDQDRQQEHTGSCDLSYVQERIHCTSPTYKFPPYSLTLLVFHPANSIKY